MVFKITLPNIDTTISARAAKNWVSSKFRRNLLMFPMGVTEIRLDDYLNKKYHISLKNACRYVFKGCSASINNRTVYLTPRTRLTNKIALTITYGTGIIPGSEILTWSLGRKN